MIRSAVANESCAAIRLFSFRCKRRIASCCLAVFATVASISMDGNRGSLVMYYSVSNAANKALSPLVAVFGMEKVAAAVAFLVLEYRHVESGEEKSL